MKLQPVKDGGPAYVAHVAFAFTERMWLHTRRTEKPSECIMIILFSVIWAWPDFCVLRPQEAVQALRLPALWGGEGAVPLLPAVLECRGLLLLHQRLHHHQWVLPQPLATSDTGSDSLPVFMLNTENYWAISVFKHRFWKHTMISYNVTLLQCCGSSVFDLVKQRSHEKCVKVQKMV